MRISLFTLWENNKTETFNMDTTRFYHGEAQAIKFYSVFKVTDLTRVTHVLQVLGMCVYFTHALLFIPCKNNV